MDRGWVKLWRKLLDSQIFQNEGLLKLAIWALLKANHEEAWVPVKTGRGITTVHLKPGQFIFGRHTAARELNMSPSTTRNRLQLARNAHFMDTQTFSHYSVGTIINWDSYQPDKVEQKEEEDNQRTTKGHKQEDIYKCEFFSVTEKQHKTYKKAYPRVNPLDEYLKMTAWLVSNPKKRKKNYPRFINNWLSKAQQGELEDWRDELRKTRF
jgi:hypothetical protein